ncbi:MAG: hypothetical protein MUP85_23195 [Candidatus Lokiarchaeota archaeon]|nr:hypothetical protein [Candidatus Lokiarchaeota archaeon]
MNIEFKIVHSENVVKPTLLLVLPFKDAIQDEIKEEISNFLQKTDEIIELKEEHREKIQDLGDYIRNIVGSKKVYGIDITMEDCDSDDERLYKKNGDTDWLFVLPRIISEYPGFRDVDNHAFRVALEETLFAALLGAATYVGGKIKSIGSSMVGIYYKKHGMCWLSYPVADMKIYLKKGIYTEVDAGHNIIYSEKMDGLNPNDVESSQLRSSTFGNYPYYSVDMYDPIADAEFVLELIKYAKDHLMNES